MLSHAIFDYPELKVAALAGFQKSTTMNPGKPVDSVILPGKIEPMKTAKTPTNPARQSIYIAVIMAGFFVLPYAIAGYRHAWQLLVDERPQGPTGFELVAASIPPPIPGRLIQELIECQYQPAVDRIARRMRYIHRPRQYPSATRTDNQSNHSWDR